MPSQRIKIVEVGARDGLQNEKETLSVETRVEFIRKLAESGLKHIEVGAFVSPKWVPQMSSSEEVLRDCQRLQKEGAIAKDVVLSCLVPNVRGMQDAIAAGAKHVAIFGSASESFSQKNINCTVKESFERFSEIMLMARKHKIKVRGYLSMCFGCPFEGEVPVSQVVKLTRQLVKMGVYEVSLGDTIGVALPDQVTTLIRELKRHVPLNKLALHLHDTRNTAIANIAKGLEMGIRVFDSSLGGLGGCPYSPKSTGNVATEDVLFLLSGLRFKTGLNFEKLIATNTWMAGQLRRELPSRVAKAGLPTGWPYSSRKTR